jgi:hypothetical protein
MKFKDQVIFDLGNEKFRHLHRVEKRFKKVNIVDLNQRLNQAKKKNFYYNTKVIFVSLLGLVIFAVISLKF